MVKWENIGFGILENMRDLEFRDFGENQEKSEKSEKSEKIGKNLRKSGKSGSCAESDCERIGFCTGAWSSNQKKSEKIRLNRNKSEKSVSEIREINENVDLGRHSPEKQNISEKSEKSEKVSFSGKPIGENQLK